jgi:hypothetical protein
MKTCHPPSAVRFRAQCTGIGQTRSESERTGLNRSQRVIDCAPAAQRKFAVGYPEPTPAEYSCAPAGQVMRQTTLR